MSDDEDDWVGEPPEGRYTRDRADPEFWKRQWQGRALAGGITLLLLLVLVLALVL